MFELEVNELTGKQTILAFDVEDNETVSEEYTLGDDDLAFIDWATGYGYELEEIYATFFGYGNSLIECNDRWEAFRGGYEAGRGTAFIPYLFPNPKKVRYYAGGSTDHILYVLIATRDNDEWRMLFMSEQDYRNEANQFMKMGWSCKLHMATAEIIIDMIQQGAPEVQFK